MLALMPLADDYRMRHGAGRDRRLPDGLEQTRYLLAGLKGCTWWRASSGEVARARISARLTRAPGHFHQLEAAFQAHQHPASRRGGRMLGRITCPS